MYISEDAFDLIVREEVGDPQYYAKRCSGFDWPGESSGPTIGIGYDLGYHSVQQIHQEWRDYVSTPTLAKLVAGSFIKGDAARKWVSIRRNNIRIPYAVAMEQFKANTLPRWIETTDGALSNCSLLHPHSFGALVSLTFNRGQDYASTSDRRREMRQIKASMELKDFKPIPDLIRSMKRIWPETSGLQGRRDREATLFQKGIDEMMKSAIVVPATMPFQKVLTLVSSAKT